MEFLPSWKPLIVCNAKTGQYTNPCNFESLVTLANNLIHDLVLLSTVLAAGAFAYAGFVLLTSGGKPSAKDEAKKIFTKVLIGYLWILGAWILIYTIMSVLVKPAFNIILGKPGQ